MNKKNLYFYNCKIRLWFNYKLKVIIRNAVGLEEKLRLVIVFLLFSFRKIKINGSVVVLILYSKNRYLILLIEHKMNACVNTIREKKVWPFSFVYNQKKIIIIIAKNTN